MFGQALGNKAFDWDFVSVPQPALDGAVLAQARGKMLGGSSGLNFMAWGRASSAEYDVWEKVRLASRQKYWATRAQYQRKAGCYRLELEDLASVLQKVRNGSSTYW